MKPLPQYQINHADLARNVGACHRCRAEAKSPACRGPCACPVDGADLIAHAQAGFCPHADGPRFGTGIQPLTWPPVPVPAHRRRARSGYGGRVTWTRTTDMTPPNAVSVLTMYTPGIADYGRLASDNHRAYAFRHGYNHVARTATIIPDWPASWSKIPMILREFDEGRGPKWVFWIDADAVFTDPSVPLSRWIDDRYDLILCHDWAGINCGVMLLQNTEATRNLLRRALSRPERLPEQMPKDHALWEQESIGQELDEGDTGCRVRVYDRMREFNSYPADAIDPALRERNAWYPGDFVLHTAGRPHKDRVAAIARVAQGMPPFPPEPDKSESSSPYSQTTTIYRDRPAPTLRQAASYVRARVSGKMVSDDVRQERERICAGCDKVARDSDGVPWCTICGCGVSNAEKQVRNLAAYEENLPRWGCKHPERGKGKGWPLTIIRHAD